MASNHYDDEVFKAKRKPKNPIRFQIQLNDEQKQAKSEILDNPVTLLRGMAGSGKTLVAAQIGFWHFGRFASEYRRVFGEVPSDTLKRQTKH